MASCAWKGSGGRIVSTGAASPAARAAATAARVAGLVTVVGGEATAPGSTGMVAPEPLAVVKSVGLMVMKRWPSWPVHDGMFMAFSLMACWKALRDEKFGASVGEEMRGMSHSCVRNSSLMLSMLACVCIFLILSVRLVCLIKKITL